MLFRSGGVPWPARNFLENVALEYSLHEWFSPDNEECAMATQIVMDFNGDTRHIFDVNDAEALAKAEERFKVLTGDGFTAAVRTASGEAKVTRSFDPAAEETLFIPRLVGG